MSFFILLEVCLPLASGRINQSVVSIGFFFLNDSQIQTILEQTIQTQTRERKG